MLAARLGLLLSALLAPDLSPAAFPRHCVTRATAKGEDVELKAADGCKIAASYTRPEGAGKRAALLLVHQMGGRKEDWADFAAAAAKAGFAVIAVDLRAHGKSANPLDREDERRAVEKWDKDYWLKTLQDIKAAKDFLVARPEVDARKIVLVGAEIGANLCLNFAAEDPEVKAVAVLSPGDNLRGVSAIEPMEKCGNRPIFGAAGESDTYSARSLKRVLDNTKNRIKDSRLYKNSNKGTKLLGTEDEPGDLTRAILEWLKTATR